MGDNKSTGVGVLGLLLVAFIVLKLCKVIDWSWWWVLAPAWIPAAIIILILIFCLALDFAREIVQRLRKRRIKSKIQGIRKK